MNSSRKRNEQTKKPVLVIGGGAAGVIFMSNFRKVDRETELILIEPKDYCELLWASYRSPFDESVARDSLVPLKSFCEKSNVKHLRTKVVCLNKDYADLEDGSTIYFSAAVVTVGASMKWSEAGNGLPNGFKGDREERLDQLKDHGEELLSSNNVVVLGGGIVGVELSGDIAGFSKMQNKDLQVTLVHSGERLASEFTAGASAMIKDKLEKLGVKVLLNERGIETKGKVVLEKSKEELSADKVVCTVGLFANNSFVKIDGAVNEKGFLATDDFFRVEGSGGKVFAFGDCAEMLPCNISSMLHNGPVIANNVMTLLHDSKKDPEVGFFLWRWFGRGKTYKMQPFHPGAEDHGIVTIGPNDGVAQLPFTYTQRVLPYIKNKTMMFPMVPPRMGLK